MPLSPAFPGLFLCFVACVLLIIVTVSSPIWNAISFLDVNVGGRSIHFGVFGFTGSGKSVGYVIDPAMFGLNANTNTTAIRNLTKLLILHPIAAALAGLATLFGFFGLSYHRGGTVCMSLMAGLATLVTLIIFVIDMALFGIVRNRLRDAADTNSIAQYGNAGWLTLGALVALLLGFCSGICGSFGSYRRGRAY